nr:immunoglobulin light chain junction region [Macaca mulatta]MOW68900.1 immunoglobulin light chain junction region [Macaca mulatta]
DYYCGAWDTRLTAVLF